MLSKADNELLCQVGPGTPMGAVMRRYWLPVLLSTELPEPDGAPLRVRLLGEDLVAFRDTSGQVGLLDAHCPHRGASLFLGRNEEDGLRCVYHGWKLDVSGQCVDMPSEPAESNFKDKIRATAYQCRERNGIIWAYLDPSSEAPDLPDIEWNLVPLEQRYVSKRMQECNWAQALEGGIDSTHSAFLHASIGSARTADGSSERPVFSVRQTHVHYEVLESACGMLLGARRDADESSYYWRVSQFLMPFYNMFPPRPSPTLGGLAWVPIDDDNTMVWGFTWHPTRPLTDAERPGLSEGRGPNAGSVGIHAGLDDYLPPTSAPGGAWRARANRANDYFRDVEQQRTRLFSGIPSIWAQDVAVQESMGPIVDRTAEHLGTSDGGIIAVRQLCLRAARELADNGTAPPGSDSPEAYRVRAAAAVLPQDVSWADGMQELLEARPGVLLEAL